MHRDLPRLQAMSSFRRPLSRRTVLALPAVAALTAGARADSWPSKPVHIVVPFAPGGSGDITARLVGKYMEEKTGQPFVIDNKPGANGIVGALAVKSAPADGYTLMLATASTNGANIHMYKNPGYDPEKDFTVVGVIGSAGNFLVVPADSPFKSLGELLAYAKANPGKLNFAYFNATTQVPPEVLANEAGVQWQGVAYKAIGNAWSDFYAGAVQFMTVDLTAARGQVVAGKARPLAVTLAERSPLYPEVPAIAETFPGFDMRGFLAVAAPKSTPDAIKGRLNELVNEAVLSPAINKRLVEEFNLNPRRMDLVQCADYDRGERERWAKYLRIAKIEPQ